MIKFYKDMRSLKSIILSIFKILFNMQFNVFPYIFKCQVFTQSTFKCIALFSKHFYLTQNPVLGKAYETL